MSSGPDSLLLAPSSWLPAASKPPPPTPAGRVTARSLAAGLAVPLPLWLPREPPLQFAQAGTVPAAVLNVRRAEGEVKRRNTGHVCGSVAAMATGSREPEPEPESELLLTLSAVRKGW